MKPFYETIYQWMGNPTDFRRRNWTDWKWTFARKVTVWYKLKILARGWKPEKFYYIYNMNLIINTQVRLPKHYLEDSGISVV